MNLLDMVIIIIMGYSLIRGFFRGLIKEFASIVAVLGGFYAAYTYYPEASKALAGILSRFDPPYIGLISFFLIFTAVFVIVSIFGLIIKYLLNHRQENRRDDEQHRYALTVSSPCGGGTR
jgi:membrane protein required for colicin V production